jgi:hypothetical protein
VTALSRHPGIDFARPLTPEPKFFLVDESYERGLDHYSRTYFADIDRSVLAGEKSTNYLESTTAARRIASDLPQVKLIFILRDPVDRAYSNWRWSTANGLESLPFVDALDAEPARDARRSREHRYSRPHAYFSRGLYADQLAPYLELLGRDRVKVVSMEHLIGSRDHLSQVHEYLGVARRPQDADVAGVVNATPEGTGTAQLPEDVRARLASRYSLPNARLAELLGPTFPIWGTP